jgi:membrane fusion protein
LASAKLQRLADLRKLNYVSEVQLQDQQAALLEQEARASSLRRTQLLARQELNALEGEIASAPVTSAREISLLERGVDAQDEALIANKAQQELVVRAAVAGTVASVGVEPGQPVAAMQNLASILPEGSRLEAEIYAPSRSIGFVRPGTPILLRYQAFPYQKFGQYRGTVREIAQAATPPAQLSAFLARDPMSQDPLYRIRVSLAEQGVHAYGKSIPLKTSMQLEADIVLEHRRLFEWVLEPLYSVTGKL